MIATGVTGARVASAFGARAWVRRIAGVLVLAFGVVDVASAAASLRAEHRDRSACVCRHHA